MKTTPSLRRVATIACSAASVAASAGAQAPDVPAIRLSQIGFLPNAPKVAVVAGATATTFAVVGAERGDTVLRG
jgi:hypothetical protein